MAINEYAPDSVSPPGETLQDALDERGMSQVELANRTGHPPKVINEIIRGKAAITPETAIQLERVLGIRARFWSNRESRYREFIAKKQAVESLKKHLAWARQFPIREMRKNKFIAPVGDDVALVESILQYFGVVSPDQFQAIWQDKQPAFRKSAAFRVDQFALIAWLRQGERVAQTIQCAEYSAENFQSALQEARKLTVERSGTIWVKLQDIFREAGVAITFIRALPRIRTSGATQWLSPKKALIQLSLRYKTNDHLWFTIFHEAGHILKHGKRSFFLEKIENAIDPKLESEANRFSADLLIPPGDWKGFAATTRPTGTAILQFARKIKIDPGIIVGRLQHENLLGRERLNQLKTRLKWA